MHAVVLAGGQGTRLRPLTDTRPKPLVPFMGEPFAAGLLRRLAQAGVRRTTFLIAQDPTPFETLEPIARTLRMTVGALTEEQPLDTAGAARRLLREGASREAVLVCNGDVLTDLPFADLVAAHERARAHATIALTRVEDTSSFGVVVCDDAGRVERFVEKPPPGAEQADTVNAGTYVLDPAVFDRFPGDGPLSFERDVFPGLLAGGATVLGYTADAYWADLGTPDRYLSGVRAVIERRCHWPAAPGMVRVGETGLAHEEATVEGAELRCAVVGEGCYVAAGARLHDAVLFPWVRVEGDAQVHGAILGEGVRVGRGAHVGHGTVLGDGARVEPGTRLP